MKLKAQIVIMSHLSDAQELNGVEGRTADLHIHINFAKYLIVNFPDTSVEIDADAEYEKFCKIFKISA